MTKREKFNLIASKVSEKCEVNLNTLLSKNRSNYHVLNARAMLFMLLLEFTTMTWNELGAWSGRAGSTVQEITQRATDKNIMTKRIYQDLRNNIENILSG